MNLKLREWKLEDAPDLSMTINNKTDETLARSLTAETTELLPFLPYLLQDLWELGSNPQDITKLIKKHVEISKDTKMLDLACGKGAASINIAKELGISVYGFDLLPDFINYAKQKAKEWGVEQLCHFACYDANKVVNTEKDYDCVIFGAAGNILGNPQETLTKLLKIVKPGGYIIFDEAYLPDDRNNNEVNFKNYDYLTHDKWLSLFKKNGLMLMDELPDTEEHDIDSVINSITKRVNELIAKHPKKRSIFEKYIQSQLSEYEDMEYNVVGVTWMLQKM